MMLPDEHCKADWPVAGSLASQLSDVLALALDALYAPHLAATAPSRHLKDLLQCAFEVMRSTSC